MAEFDIQYRRTTRNTAQSSPAPPKSSGCAVFFLAVGLTGFLAGVVGLML